MPSADADGTDEDLEAVPQADPPRADDAPASVPDDARQITTGTGTTVADRQIPVLTLGAGLALMGLGIGFLGIRMRRR
ncbi:hypothetical protein EAO71_01675 [Streptomyces sp. ms191]|uniref:hypothetical protein n=1 Tax=unclassified Streptomyces TaxID=2593676 RepID=UPI0011CE11CB|nr:hypothetical protein [Streptomyces sp. ms191]TXS34309.1 hypothetical protein EAO71_01675 [Streptomyces sp. ms191]